MNCKRSWRACLRLAAASLVLISISACSTSPTASAPVARQLPSEPAFAKPVTVRHRIDDDLELVAVRERAGRARANDVIECFVRWYRGVQVSYGQAAAEASASEAQQVCERDLKKPAKKK